MDNFGFIFYIEFKIETMEASKFKTGCTYLICDKEKLNTIKITVLPYREDTYYIHWHDEGKGQFCSKEFFDNCFDIVKVLPQETVRMRF